MATITPESKRCGRISRRRDRIKRELLKKDLPNRDFERLLTLYDRLTEALQKPISQ
jgi:hypothetical protein